MMTTRLIADFDNTLNDALNGVVEAEAALGQMYRAALARVAELEAQAAQQWIEVDDDPDMYNWYLTYNAEAEDLDNIGMNVSFYDGTWEHECTHYRPLPPAPQERTQ